MVVVTLEKLMEGVPTVVALAESNATAGLLLVIVTVTGLGGVELRLTLLDTYTPAPVVVAPTLIVPATVTTTVASATPG